MTEPVLTHRFGPSSLPSNPSSLRLETIQSQSPQVVERNDPFGFFSPVNEAGSFEFDRVIKSASVLKRTKRTKAWKSVRLVLRPNLLSVYKDQDETQLRHQLRMSEVHAVALRKDVKRKGDHQGVFGVFMPSRNFHFEASSKEEADAWVNLIRKEASMDGEHRDMTIPSPGGGSKTYAGFGRASRSVEQISRTSRDSSSFDGGARSRASSSAMPHSIPIPIRRPSHAADTSGSEHNTYSDSEAVFGSAREFSPLSTRNARDSRTASVSTGYNIRDNAVPPMLTTNESKASVLEASNDENRVVWQGFLQVLKSTKGVKQWKKYWVVLRPKQLALYKNEEEYSAILIISVASILDAVDTDPVSKGKEHCMQIICEERSYRFCAANEDELTKWLGSLKSLLAKRKEPAR